MKFTPLISGLFLSLAFLPQAAQADIPLKDAKQKLELIRKLMQDRGIQETFTILNNDSGQRSTSPDSRDQIDSSEVQELLSGNAGIVCVENSVVVVNTLKREEPDVDLNTTVAALKSSPKSLIPVAIETTKTTTIENASTHKPLEIKQLILAADSKWLLGERYQPSNDQRKKFFCFVKNVTN